MSCAARWIKTKCLSLLQVDGRLSVEALVLSFHVGETREVVWINKRQVDLGEEN